MSRFREAVYSQAALGSHDEAVDKLSPIPRITARLIGSLSVESQVNLVTHSYRKIGEQVLGIGYHSVVLADTPTSVRKIHHRTAHMSPDEHRLYIESLEAGQQLLKEFFPDQVREQFYSIGALPPDPSRDVVIAHQERVDKGIGVDFLKPAHTETVSRFLAECSLMNYQCGFMPDIVGRNNVVQIDNELAIIDTVPLSGDSPDDSAAYIAAQSILNRAA